MKTFLKSAIYAAAIALATPVLAEDAHHLQAAGQTQAAPAQQTPGQSMWPSMAPGSGGMPYMMGQGSMMGGSGMMMGGPGMPGMMQIMMGGSGMMMGGPGMPGMMQMMQGGARVDGRLAFLKAELKITPEQEKAWTDFATALRQVAAKARDSGGMMRGMSGEAGNAMPPQMLEQYEQHLTQRLEAVRTLRTVLTPFYAVLSDEQKKTLAQLHPMFVGMM